MEPYQFWTVIGTFGGALAWVIARQEKLFDKIEAIGNRLNRLEGEVEGVKSMLQTIVGFLLGHKTGTDGKP